MKTPSLLHLVLLGGCAVALAGCARSTVTLDAAAARADDDKKADKKPDEPAPSGEPFRFPNDHGGQLLGKVLPPSLPPATDAATAPLPLPAPASVAHPEVPLHASPTGLVRYPLPARSTALRPHAPLEDVPLTAYRDTPTVPDRIIMAPGARIHIPSLPVEQPPALPILAQFGVDRVPLEDPTTDESLKAALSAVVPVRTTPAPFDRRGLPDPFEHVLTIRLKTLPAEDSIPASGSPLLSRP